MPTQRTLTSLLFAAATAATAQSQPAHSGRPIEAAALPLPEHLRAGATIVHEADDGATTELRKGTNAMVCVDATTTDTMMGPIRGYNAARNAVSAEVKRWQTISVPFATGASLGLPERPSEDMPWVMHPGMWMAHIMIEHGPTREPGSGWD